MSAVPLLDQRAWEHGSASERRAFAAEFRASFERIGFVRIIGHGIHAEALERAQRDFRAFFALPEAAKLRVGGVAGGARGYTPFGVEHARDQRTPDLKEFFHVGRECAEGLARSDEQVGNRWPQELPELRGSAMRLHAQLEQCSAVLLQALAAAYELPERVFSEMLVDGNSILRALHYPPLAESAPAGALRAAPHEDINLITLLCEASDAGLEVLTPSGWRPVECAREELVVDAGDMLRQLTGGVIPATTHRVVNPASGSAAARRSRYSLPFFAHPRSECDLSVLESFATPERLRCFPPIRADEFLARRLREIGLRDD